MNKINKMSKAEALNALVKIAKIQNKLLFKLSNDHKYHLRNWSVLRSESGNYHLHGFREASQHYGLGRHVTPERKEIITGEIIKVNGNEVTTGGGDVYILNKGDVNEYYSSYIDLKGELPDAPIKLEDL